MAIQHLSEGTALQPAKCSVLCALCSVGIMGPVFVQQNVSPKTCGVWGIYLYKALSLSLCNKTLLRQEGA
jgi:hypothetical protein